MTRTSIGTGAALALLALGAAVQAQQPGSNRGSPLPGGGTTRDLTMPGQGGVAGTGLGGTTGGSGDGATSGAASGNTAPGIPGTGMSVKGPAGQGIDGKGIDEKGIAAGTPGGAGATAGAKTPGAAAVP